MNNSYTSPADLEANARNFLQRAMAQHEQGNFFDADRLYAQTLNLQPDNIQALRLRGILAREHGDVTLALKLLNQAVQLAPQSAQAIAERGLTQLAIGNLQAAEDDLQAARNRAPDNAGILINLGALFHHRGHLQAACELYRDALARDADDMEVRCNLAKALADGGAGEQALKEARNAVERAQHHPVALATLGAVLLDLHRYPEAREVLAQATTLQPDNDMALVNYALSCDACDDAAGAMRALQQAVEANPYNARAAADLINALSAAGDNAAAIHLGENFLQQHPGERLIVGSYAQALLNADHTEAALILLDCEQLVQVFDWPLEEKAGTAESNSDLNIQLAAAVLTDSSRVNNPNSKSTHGGEQTGELRLDRDPTLQAFEQRASESIQAAVAHYSNVGLNDHPVLTPASEHWQLRAWGTVLQSGGYQSPHMHPLGWLSAVYYAELPADMNAGGEYAGWLQFGAPPTRFHQRRPAPIQRYEPRPGRLIVFPSWFWHQTVPFNAGSARISLAFDVMPQARLTRL